MASNVLLVWRFQFLGNQAWFVVNKIAFFFNKIVMLNIIHNLFLNRWSLPLFPYIILLSKVFIIQFFTDNMKFFKLLLLAFTFNLSVVMAQESFVTSGGSLSTNHGSVSFSIGQVCAQFLKTDLCKVSCGVQQTFSPLSSSSLGDSLLHLSPGVFPNPANGVTTLKLNGLVPDLSYCLYDVSGILLDKRKIDGHNTEIQLGDSPLLILSVFSGENIIKTFKIINRP